MIDYSEFLFILFVVTQDFGVYSFEFCLSVKLHDFLCYEVL